MVFADRLSHGPAFNAANAGHIPAAQPWRVVPHHVGRFVGSVVRVHPSPQGERVLVRLADGTMVDWLWSSVYDGHLVCPD